MDFGARLEELKLTTDEVDRLSKALKNEKFREMLHEYAEEISNPENKKRYEEEIMQMERERGINVQFIHRKPHHVLKTSVNSKEKCFINICSNELISKPSLTAGQGKNGDGGQHWSLPYCLIPGRSDQDDTGNTCTIYDVVFHPDTLYIAEKNNRFMKLVNSTATQGIEDAFQVKLDKTNVKALKAKYKGVPHPAIIRKPIPGHPGIEEASADEGLFLIPSPDAAKSSPPQNLTEESFPSPQQFTVPHYTLKYSSVMDLQDYRCSRYSAPSPRPKEIIITIILPLIKSVGDIVLNVTERDLVMESQKPAYKLELHLSYPVDHDKGHAKFNKSKKELIITLPLLPTMERVFLADGKQLINYETDKRVSENVEEVVCEAKDGQNDPKHSCNSGNVQCLGQINLQVDESGIQSFGEEETGSCTLRDKGKYDSNIKSTVLSTLSPVAVLENVRQCPQRADTGDVPEHESLSEKAYCVIPDDPTRPFQQPTGKPVMEPSLVSVNSALDEDTGKNVNFPEEAGMQPEKQQLKRLGLKTPAIYRETIPEDSSEIISNHATSADLSFQNLLWFELD
ncbi:protein kintoun [Hoplias malabaricus]|uniref:protein kintoun n=1 Tax=Hoplias malabaricus TaxID=27720 RepID=UPI003462E54C